MAQCNSRNINLTNLTALASASGYPYKPTETTKRQFCYDLNKFIQTKTENDATCVLKKENEFYGVDSADAEWRLKLRQAWTEVAAQGEAFVECNLIDVFEPGTLKILTASEKNSASDSIILFGSMRPPIKYRNNSEFLKHWARIKCDVVVKVSFPNLTPHIVALWKSNYPSTSNSVSPSDMANGIDALSVEVRLYNMLADLLANYITPNLMAFYGVWSCTIGEFEQNALAAHTRLQSQDASEMQMDNAINIDTFQKESEIVKKFANEVSRIYSAYNTEVNLTDQLRFVVLEKGRGNSLADALEKNSITEDQLISVLFQTIYTMHVLGERGIRHGDLHTGNLFIDPLANKQISLAYFLFEKDTDASVKFAVLPTVGLLVKIFDWDRGSVTKTPHDPLSKIHWPDEEIRNTMSDLTCDSISSCNYNPKADIYTLLSNLYAMPTFAQRFPRVKMFIESHVQRNLLLFGNPNSKKSFSSEGGFQYRLCGGPLQSTDTCELQQTGNKCILAWVPPDCIMHSLSEMLFDETLFANIWHEYPAEIPNTPYVYGNWQSIEQRKAILTNVASQWPTEHRDRLRKLNLI